MSAPETPTALPVVPCGIFFAGQRVLVTATVDPPIGDIPALAVPEALWHEPTFIAAVWQRVTYSETLVLGETVAAIAAELRARAVVP